MDRFEAFLSDAIARGEREFEFLSPQETQEFLIRFNQEIGALIESYSRDEIGDAVWYIYGCVSGWTFDLFQPRGNSSLEPFYQSLRSLYDNGFAAYCRDAAGHSDADTSPLASACYMLWDMDSGLEHHSFRGEPAARTAMEGLLDFGLAHPHAAVQESFLHGLGHRTWQEPEYVHHRIDRFLLRTDLSGEIREYAQACRSGCIL